MSDQRAILDTANFRNTGALPDAVLPSALSIQNVNNILCQVDDLGNVTPLIGGTIGGITAITGDVVATGPGVVNSVIQPGRVTYAKIQNVSANSFLGNPTGAPTSVEEISAATAKTMLGLAAIATSGSAADLTSGTLPAGRFPALTGDVTTVAGSLATTVNIPQNLIPFGNASGHMTTSNSLVFNPASLAVLSPGGTATPTSTFLGQITAISESGAGTIASQTYSANAATGGAQQMYRARGTFATPLNVQDGDSCGQVGYLGYAGGLFQSAAITRVEVWGAPLGTIFDSVWYIRQATPLAGNASHSLAVSSKGDVALGDMDLAALKNPADTFGFVYYSSTNGAQTGVPVLPTRPMSWGAPLSPTIIDATNHRFYAYLGGAWHYAAFDDGAAAGITELVGDGTAGPGTGIQTLTLATQGGLTPGAYTSVNLTVNAKGIITAVASGGGGGTITALTGDVTASGSGSVTATIAAGAVTTAKIAAANITTALIATGNITTALIAANAVTYAKIQTQADQTILGNVSGGAAVPAALTKSQVEALLQGSLATGIVGVTTGSGVLNSSSLTATEVMFATGANTIGQSSNFTFASNTLSVPAVIATTVEGGAANLINLKSESTGTVVLTLDGGAAHATINADLVPLTNGGASLGSTSLEWSQLYVTTVNGNGGANLLALKSESTGAISLTLDAGNSQLTAVGKIVPGTTATYDLGSSSALWLNAYVGNAFVTNVQAHTSGIPMNFVDNAGHTFLTANSGSLTVASTTAMSIAAATTLSIGGTTGITISSASGVDLGLTPGGSGGLVKFTNSMAVTGIVACTVSGLGPAGANTAVQEWLMIKNSSGTVRYIPCF